MSQVQPPEPGERSGPVAGETDSRLASVVHIMKGRRSIRSSLGVLELDDGSVSLRTPWPGSQPSTSGARHESSLSDHALVSWCPGFRV